MEQFDHFLKASQVSNDLKVSVFITAIGKKACKTLKTLLEPEKPENKTYTQLVQTLQEQCVPKTSGIAERFKFNRRFQQDCVMVAVFTVELKRLATSCNIDAFSDEALRNRFVAGLCDKEMKTELLKKSKPTFIKCLRYRKEYRVGPQGKPGCLAQCGARDSQRYSLQTR